jgi:hypothetical protein
MWKNLLAERSLELLPPMHGGSRGGRPRPVPPVRKPSPRDLDGAEAALEVALPASYREFCCELGPGVLRDWIRIYAPCADVKYVDLVTYGKDWRHFDDSHLHQESWWRPYSFPVNDLVTFADTMSGDVFGFYPKEPTTGDEYAIYLIDREPPPDTPVVELVRVAASFVGFIDAVFDGRIEGGGRLILRAEDAPMTWKPFGRPPVRRRATLRT